MSTVARTCKFGPGGAARFGAMDTKPCLVTGSNTGAALHPPRRRNLWLWSTLSTRESLGFQLRMKKTSAHDSKFFPSAEARSEHTFLRLTERGAPSTRRASALVSEPLVQIQHRINDLVRHDVWSHAFDRADTAWSSPVRRWPREPWCRRRHFGWSTRGGPTRTTMLGARPSSYSLMANGTARRRHTASGTGRSISPQDARAVLDWLRRGPTPPPVREDFDRLMEDPRRVSARIQGPDHRGRDLGIDDARASVGHGYRSRGSSRPLRAAIHR